MKSHRYVTTIIYLYYILFFVLPFVVLPVNSELFEFNKMLFIYAIAILIGGMWILRCFQEKRFVIRKSPFDIPLALFLCSQIVSTLVSIDTHTSIFGYYGRFNGGLLSTFTYMFLYYAFISNLEINKKEIVRVLLGISIASSIGVVLWGIPGKFNHDLSCLLFTNKFDNTCWTAQFKPAERMFSTLGQPNWLGAYLAVNFFLSVFILFSSQTRRSRILGGVGVLFSYGGILLSRSRSSMASLIPGVILLCTFILILIFRKSHWISTFRKKVFIFGIGCVLFITFVTKTGVSQIDSFLSLSLLKKTTQTPITTSSSPVQTNKSLIVVGPITESLDIRKIVWDGAWELGIQYPLFGTGVETFGYAYYSVRPASHNLTSEWDYLYNKAHNEYLNLLATTGWFGLGSFILFVIWMGVGILIRMVKNRKDNNSVLYYLSIGGIYISLCITNFFGFSTTVVNMYWYIILGLLVMYNEPDYVQIKNNKTSWSQIGVVILLVLWMLNFVGTYWLGDYKYAQSDIALKSNDIGRSITLLQEALVLRQEHIYEDKLSYAFAQYAYMSSYQKDTSNQQLIMNNAEKLNMKSIQSSPKNVMYWKTRVKNQYIFYQMSLDKKYLFTGLAALEEASKLAPTDPKITYFFATYYSLLYDDEKDVKQKDFYMKKSIASIDKTIMLKSDYGDAHYLKVQLLQKYGKKIEAKKLLEWYIPRYAPTNEELKKDLLELQ